MSSLSVRAREGLADSTRTHEHEKARNGVEGGGGLDAALMMPVRARSVATEQGSKGWRVTEAKPKPAIATMARATKSQAQSKGGLLGNLCLLGGALDHACITYDMSTCPVEDPAPPRLTHETAQGHTTHDRSS